MRSALVSAARLLFASVFVFSLTPSHADSIPAEAYVIADNTTGFILQGANVQKKVQVGSLAKVAMAMVVLDWADAKGSDLNQQVRVPDSSQALSNGSGVGFRPGDSCSLRDLLYAALMQSDNQAAETLAAHVGMALGAREEPVVYFVAQMNALARKLGMSRTRFVNPHGLDGLERALPFSTAEDISKLTRYAMERAAFRFYVSQTERKITIYTAAGEPSSYMLRNTNELLNVDNIDGVKTGTTRRAGPCVVISSARPPESRHEGERVVITPRRLNVVVLGSQRRFDVARDLMGKGWQIYQEWAAAGRPTKDWKRSR